MLDITQVWKIRCPSCGFIKYEESNIEPDMFQDCSACGNGRWENKWKLPSNADHYKKL